MRGIVFAFVKEIAMQNAGRRRQQNRLEEKKKKKGLNSVFLNNLIDNSFVDIDWVKISGNVRNLF